jgi:hypothetical protein
LTCILDKTLLVNPHLTLRIRTTDHKLIGIVEFAADAMNPKTLFFFSSISSTL